MRLANPRCEACQGQPRCEAMTIHMIFVLHIVKAQIGGAARQSDPCESWCTAPFVRSWACETASCAPCRAECEAVAFPQRQLPKVDENSRVTKRRVGAVYPGMSDTWSCRATWPPHHLFTVFAMARTGSTTVCSVLNTLKNTRCAYEVRLASSSFLLTRAACPLTSSFNTHALAGA